MRRLLSLIALLALPHMLAAQPRDGRTSFYPDELYPGENVILIRNAAGIDKVRFSASSMPAVEMPTVTGCPTELRVRVRVDDPTTSEQVDFTVYDCNGGFGTTTLRGQNWQIRKEYTGRVMLGRDTCLPCEIVTSEMRLVDSIVVDNPRFRVIMPPGRGPWRAEGSDFKYTVCYRPEAVEDIRETIHIYIRREQTTPGLTQYVIDKPLTAVAVPPPPPKTPPPPKPADTLPPLVDPTTFRNILMPTAETVGAGHFFAGSYDVAGLIAGYGATDRLMVMVGTVTVPEFLSKLLVVTAGAKYEVVESGKFRAALGFQFGYTSTAESDITVSAPYAVLSYGDRANRINIAGGYSWKHHQTSDREFDRNAYVLGIGGDVTIGRGMKIAAESYVIESSGIAPIALTFRWFGEQYAVDAGLAVDLARQADIRGTGPLSGEARHLPIAPVLSFLWKW